jgi:methionine synthase II (cobalamin-independent)
MADPFNADGLPVLIGSLPLADHQEACKLVLDYTPEIPLWIQLPVHKAEGMVAQFMPGLPGLCSQKDSFYVDTDKDEFDADLLQFFEDYMSVLDGNTDLLDSRFVLKADTANGFFVFIEKLRNIDIPPVAVKGQITGPFTFGTGVPDQNKRAIFYDEQLREAAVKHLAMKARWQVRQLSQFERPVIIFIDEPALAGFGSSEFISISRDEIAPCLEEVIEAVHLEGGLAGVHVCANTDWSLILKSSADIVSFDAYSFFDRFILYADDLKAFLEMGGKIAWGMVPTLEPDRLDRETTDSLVQQWRAKARQVEKLGFDSDKVLSQSLITPSCGAGSLSPDRALKALTLTREVSQRIRQRT